MILDKIKELENKEKQLKNLPKILEIKNAIRKLQEDLRETSEPYQNEINTLDEEIKTFISKRLKLLNSNNYFTNMYDAQDIDNYQIDNDKLVIMTSDYYRGEEDYYEDELPLSLFTCQDKEVVNFIENLKNKKIEAKLAKEKQAALEKLQEIEKYEKETGIKVKEIWSI